MTVAGEALGRETGLNLQKWRWTAAWASLVVLALVLAFDRSLISWASDYPKEWIVPIADWVSALMNFLKRNFTWLTRGISDVIGVPVNFVLQLLAKGFKIGRGLEAVTLPSLSWVGVVAASAIVGHRLGGMRLALLAGLCMLYIALFGQWQSSMLTLALILVCVPMCIAVGLVFGIWGYRNPWIDRLLITPVLDLMQTMPTFAYLIPMLLLFGNSPVSAMLATAIFATPPMVRATILGLSRVPPRSTSSDGWPAARLPAALADPDPLGAADADGRRQPGHHARPQHGDHRLDDRGGRPRLRRAAGAESAEGRTGDGSRPRRSSVARRTCSTG
ncbi:MAG: hypothetical protein R3D33_03310 [Hyphomicrobiaceae bacterium]